jgi:hypothetical protein
LRNGILPVYGITLAGAPAKPFANFVKAASARYGWPLLAETENAALARTVADRLPGVAEITSAASRAGTLSVRLEVHEGGPQVLILGGRRLAERAPTLVLDGRTLDGCRRNANWAVCTTETSAGALTIELPSREWGPDPEADYLYFLALVQRERLSGYVRVSFLETASSEERPRPSGSS